MEPSMKPQLTRQNFHNNKINESKVNKDKDMVFTDIVFIPIPTT